MEKPTNNIRIFEVMNFIYNDEPIRALELVETLDGDIFRIVEDKLRQKLEHITNPDKYTEKYKKDKALWRPGFVWSDRHAWVLHNLLESNARSFIDLGCYEGTLVIRANSLGIDSVGVDICEEIIAWDKKESNDKITFISSAIEDFEIDRKFDAVSCLELIEHVPDPDKIVSKIRSLLNDKGTGYISTPNGCYDCLSPLVNWETPGALFDHVRTFNRSSLAKFLNIDIKDVEEQPQNLFAVIHKNDHIA